MLDRNNSGMVFLFLSYIKWSLDRSLSYVFMFVKVLKQSLRLYWMWKSWLCSMYKADVRPKHWNSRSLKSMTQWTGEWLSTHSRHIVSSHNQWLCYLIKGQHVNACMCMYIHACIAHAQYAMCFDIAMWSLKFNMEDFGGIAFMSIVEFAAYLSATFDEELVDLVKRNKISGATFLNLTKKPARKNCTCSWWSCGVERIAKQS